MLGPVCICAVGRVFCFMLQIEIAKASKLHLVRIPLYLIGRFWSYVDRPSLKSCWPWMRARNDYGYGSFELGQFGNIYSHRLAYAFKAGGLQIGEQVRHSCDNPPCCNPWHLLGGTVKDNVQDSIARGRFGAGGPPKVTAGMRFEIQAASFRGVSRREIANQFGLHVATIYRILQK